MFFIGKYFYGIRELIDGGCFFFVYNNFDDGRDIYIYGRNNIDFIGFNKIIVNEWIGNKFFCFIIFCEYIYCFVNIFFDDIDIIDNNFDIIYFISYIFSSIKNIYFYFCFCCFSNSS